MEQEPLGRVLRGGELHLWLLTPQALDESDGEAALSEEERCWSGALPGAVARAWRRRRGALRRILAGYLGQGAPSLAIINDAAGKPCLADSALQFNLSESGGWMLVGVCADQPVGVDLELESEHRDLQAWAVARRYFQESELAVLEAAERSGRLGSAFLRLWTRKEARLKLWGSGLRGLESLAEEGLQIPESRAWVEDLNPAPGVCAAVALPRAPTWLQVQPWSLGACALPSHGEGAWTR